MKRSILTAVCFAAGFSAIAQKASIQDANDARKEKEYMTAIGHIEKAMGDPSTKDMPKTWFVRANIYSDMQNDTAYNKDKPYRKAAESYIKVAELDPKYEKETVSTELRNELIMYYNDVLTAYKTKNYAEIPALIPPMQNIKNAGQGKIFASDKLLDTLISDAKLYNAYGLYNSKRYDEVLPVLMDLRTNSPIQSEDMYRLLIGTYKNLNKEDDLIATIGEAKQHFPKNKDFENEELQYYSRTGKQDVLLQKLETAVTNDPTNDNYLSVLASAYATMAFPKDANGKDLPKPAQYEAYLQKANDAYTRLLGVAPNNAEYNYNAGAFYFNQGSNYVSEMNKVDGNTAADKKKIDELSAKANDAFNQSIQYFEKATAQLEPKLASMNNDDKSTYWSSLSALKQIYARQNKMDKVAEMKAKMDAMKK